MNVRAASLHGSVANICSDYLSALMYFSPNFFAPRAATVFSEDLSSHYHS